MAHPRRSAPQLIEGRVQGRLAAGTITADDHLGDLQGGTIDDLVGAMQSGDIYVNVHTSEHPGGEIRGQVD